MSRKVTVAMFKTKITAIALATVLTVSAISLTSCMKNGEEESSNATANGTSGGIGETVSEIVSDIADGMTDTEEVSKENAENGHVTDTAESESAENESGSRRNMTAIPYQGK